MNKNNNSHSELADAFNKDEERVNWHDETLWFVRQKRDARASEVEHWEYLRNVASQIKDNVLSDLCNYLKTFEMNLLANGCEVHWAVDAEEHNQIVHKILLDNEIKTIVKSKSMLTEECALNDFLKRNGIEVTDSDLGEFIIQLSKEAPSHIVMPCIHMKKEEIGDLFHRHLGIDAGVSDPQLLTEVARQHLRKVFLSRKATLTGVNFAIAETGEIVVCTNEGNADLATHLAQVHIASMGIEKIIPKRNHLSIFLRLLARSATGQSITTYSSHFRRPDQGKQIHVIIVDNGRSRQLGRPAFRNSLKCIRCGACMNTCPVYRRSGGHSYQHVIAGPIGSILSPNIDMKKHADLPFASTLCGSCTNVCPVKIDIHNQLYEWRQIIAKEGYLPPKKVVQMHVLNKVLSIPWLFSFSGKMGRFVLKHLGFLLKNKWNPWYKKRDFPEVPSQSFAAYFIQQQKSNIS